MAGDDQRSHATRLHDHSEAWESTVLGGSIAHSSTTGQTASDHHAKYTDGEARTAMLSPAATDDLGTQTTNEWRHAYLSGALYADSVGSSLAPVTGVYTTLINGGTSTLNLYATDITMTTAVVDGSVTSDGLHANVTASSDIGSSGTKWRDLYLSGTANVDTQVITPEVELTSGGPTWTKGTGTPEGVVTAPVGSIFSRTDGGAGTSFYVKESGTGNTGWVAK